METIHGFDTQFIEIDRHGQVKSGADDLTRHVRDNKVSDVILICHGFRNDEADARRWYGRFLETFAVHRGSAALATKLGNRTFAVGGILWPSMILPEPNDDDGTALSTADSTATDRLRLESVKAELDAESSQKVDTLLELASVAQDSGNARLDMAAILIELARHLADGDENEVSAGLARSSPAALCEALMADTVDVPPAGDAAATGIPQLSGGATGLGQGASFFGKVFGFVPKFVNLTTFLLMFGRCGTVGEKGISKVVRSVRSAAPAVRVHLVGHSLGGRAVTSCAKALLETPQVNVDTMLLLQAAYSHFGLGEAATAPVKHPRGHFRDVIVKGAVKGPILATHSTHDRVITFAYTPMAAISLNNARAIGDEKSPYGGIGRNGVLDATEARRDDLHEPGVPYAFTSGTIHNLNGSRSVGGKPLIASHGDVTSEEIAWAFASLVASV